MPPLPDRVPSRVIVEGVYPEIDAGGDCPLDAGVGRAHFHPRLQVGNLRGRQIPLGRQQISRGCYLISRPLSKT